MTEVAYRVHEYSEDVGKRIKASKTIYKWVFSFGREGALHTVRMKLSGLSGRKEIMFDGEPVFNAYSIDTSSFNYTWMSNGHQYNVRHASANPQTRETTIPGQAYVFVIDGIPFGTIHQRTPPPGFRGGLAPTDYSHPPTPTATAVVIPGQPAGSPADPHIGELPSRPGMEVHSLREAVQASQTQAAAQQPDLIDFDAVATAPQSPTAAELFAPSSPSFAAFPSQAGPADVFAAPAPAPAASVDPFAPMPATADPFAAFPAATPAPAPAVVDPFAPQQPAAAPQQPAFPATQAPTGQGFGNGFALPGMPGGFQAAPAAAPVRQQPMPMGVPMQPQQPSPFGAPQPSPFGAPQPSRPTAGGSAAISAMGMTGVSPYGLGAQPQAAAVRSVPQRKEIDIDPFA